MGDGESIRGEEQVVATTRTGGDGAPDGHRRTGVQIPDPLDEAIALADAADAKIASRIKARVEEVAEIAAAATHAFRNFDPSTHPARQRAEDVTYLPAGGDVSAAMEQVMAEDLAAMEEHDMKKGLAVSLSEAELAALDIQVVEGAVVPSRIDLDAVAHLLQARLPVGPILSSSLAQACQAELAADGMLEASGAAPEAPAAPDGQSPPAAGTAVDAQALVQQQVATQLAHVSSPEEQLTFGVASRATQATLQAAVTGLVLRGGPADVTSYHDFHDLQIAFRHVWTELLDPNLRKAGLALYEELVKLKKYAGDTSATDVATTSDDLKRLMDDLEKLRAVAASADGRLLVVQEIFPDCTAEIWVRLDDTSKKTLYSLASTAKKLRTAFGALGIPILPFLEPALQPGKMIIEAAKGLPGRKTSRAEKMLTDLEARLTGTYAFDVFAPGSVNYGILVTYRQRWTPLDYQIGELVSTIPLAPKEVRRFTKREVVRRTRAEKETETSLSVKRGETTDTSRTDAEIVRRAETKTNFQHAAEGGVNFAVWNAKGSHSLAIDSAKQSSDVKRSFREAVLKSAEEYRQDHRLEVSTQSAEEYEASSSGEIANPNDELPVTYLFYELQRRYEISEQIRKLTPVILVANDVPDPGQIDEEWLIAHDWILRKAILDDSYLPALDYLSKSFVGDEVSVDVMRHAWLTQLDIVERITQQVTEGAKILEQAQKAADAAVERYAQSLTQESEGFFESIGEFLFGGEADTGETVRVRMEAAKEALQRVEREQQALRARLTSETTALERATTAYTKALEAQFNRRTEILRLRAHVRDNILHYMQAIWDHEPPDQRFFRLYKTKVKNFSVMGNATGQVAPKPSGPTPSAGGQQGIYGTVMTIPLQIVALDATLEEVADLDELLGYKGNYMVFPLKKTNTLTTWMMQDYVDLHVTARLWDPDELANYRPEELLALVRCMRERNPQAFDKAAKAQVRDTLIKVLSSPNRPSDEVVVPTDSLYIEALPGAHPILEDFKLIHRAVDVKKAQADVRHQELENVRHAARVLAGELEDADVDKRILIDTAPAGISVDTE